MAWRLLSSAGGTNTRGGSPDLGPGGVVAARRGAEEAAALPERTVGGAGAGTARLPLRV